MSDWWIKVHGDRDPSPLVGYQELALAAPVALGGDEARWVSLAGIARLDDDSNVELSGLKIANRTPPDPNVSEFTFRLIRCDAVPENVNTPF